MSILSLRKREQFITSPDQLTEFAHKYGRFVPGRFYAEVCHGENGHEEPEPVEGTYIPLDETSESIVFEASDPDEYPQLVEVSEELVARGAVSVISRLSIPER